MVNVRAKALGEVRYLMLPFLISSYLPTPNPPSPAQRIAFNREQRMFKVSMTYLLLTSGWWEQDVMGGKGGSEGMVMDPCGVSYFVGS